MLVHWIWLATRPSVSDRLKMAILERFGDPEDVYYAEEHTYRSVEGLTEEGEKALCDKSLQYAQQVMAECAGGDIHILTYRDAAYPARLKNISDPPLVLYYKGQLPDFDGQPLIAVVGTRRASPYGLLAAKRMGYQIAKCGGVVVSGVAAGIDAASMSGALTAGGTVIGVLGCGADVVYPLSNRALFGDTCRHGCLLTEFPPGTPPQRWNFPKRNRIISGLSCGVLVVEAPHGSGALITARQAADQGRDVFVVPGNIDVPSFEGSNALLRDGAISVSKGWQILSEYQAIFPEKIRHFDSPGMQTVYPEELEQMEQENLQLKVAQQVRVPKSNRQKTQQPEKIVIDNGEKLPYSDGEKSAPQLSEEEKLVVAQLKQGRRLRDDVIADAALPAGQVSALLTMLEIKGVVKRLPGNMLELK